MNILIVDDETAMLDILREAILEKSRQIKQQNQSLPREPEDWELELDN